jgi:hypothetical protein
MALMYIIWFVGGIKELVIEYVLNQHRQDLISILEAQDVEQHYSVVVQ